MKGLCTVSTGDIVNILVKGKTMPLVGKYYVIEAVVDKGTAKQNRTLHPLLDCMYSWMLENDTYQFESNKIEYDFRCNSMDALKKIFKIKYGKGADEWEYVNDSYGMVKTDDLKSLPDYVIDDFQNGNRERIKASHAVSWKLYNKSDRLKLIDNVINIMKSIGVDTQKFYDILEGIKDE